MKWTFFPFGVLFFFLSLSLSMVPFALGQTPNWYKGALHSHTLWSDGNTLPEVAVENHIKMGYHFYVISDHSELQTNPDRWRELPADSPQITTAKKYGPLDERDDDEGKHFVRLKTIWELKKEFDRPGEFLLIPGMEQNAHLTRLGPEQFSLHANAINIAETIPWPLFDTPVECMRDWLKNTNESAQKHQLQSLWMVNHPFWVYYDVLPEHLIEVPEVQFFELNADGLEVHKPHPNFCERDRFWDIVCAFRLAEGNPAIYMTGGDDSHNHLNFKDNASCAGIVWNQVRASELTADALVTAMKQGDYYVSSGVALDDVTYDPESKTLTVKVRPEEGVHYRIDFIGTKADFDRTTIEHEIKAQLPADEFKSHVTSVPHRVFKEYSQTIGQVFQSVEGTQAAYTLSDDDLYVRALITSDKKPSYTGNHMPKFESAWTQPVGWKERLKER